MHPRYWFLLSASVTLFLCGCPGSPLPSTDAGPPPDAGPCFCAGEKDPCGNGQSCCGNLTCQNGVCVAAHPPKCAAFGEACGASMPCCVPPAPDGGWPFGEVPPVPGCRGLDSGISVCLMGGAIGDSCGVGSWGCANGLTCVNGQCVEPNTGQNCPSTRDGGQCLPGDNCYTGLTQGNDNCLAWGLFCTSTSTGYACETPFVLQPPNFPQAQGLTALYSVCDPTQDHCQPYPGDTARFGCGSYFVPGNVGTNKVPVCVEFCESGDDCGSLATDCVNGQCVPNYCYVESPDKQGTDVAGEISKAQGTPVSNDPTTVLFKPCANGGPNTVCLPANDNNFFTTAGFCYRVGDADAGAGGVGASCDPSGARTDLGSLCQSGTLCMQGTCLPWCDTGGLVKCASNQQCIAINGALVTSTANRNGTGVCAETCSPYVDAQHNTCAPLGCGTAPMVCKPSGVDNDLYPSPGICVGGSTQPVAIGQPCDPTEHRDPCVSGAICILDSTGRGHVCAQMCDPIPSPGVTAPSCPSGTTCTQLGAPHCVDYTNKPNYTCRHLGACE